MIDFIKGIISRYPGQPDTNGDSVTVIEPKSGWQPIDFKELRAYSDLFYFLVWRDIKVMYAQTILGFAWAVLQPLIQIVIFTVIFGKVAKRFGQGQDTALGGEGNDYLIANSLILPDTPVLDSSDNAIRLTRQQAWRTIQSTFRFQYLG